MDVDQKQQPFSWPSALIRSALGLGRWDGWDRWRRQWPERSVRELESHLWPWRLVLGLAAVVMVEVPHTPVALWPLCIAGVAYACGYVLLRASKLQCPAFCLLLFSLDIAAITVAVFYSGGSQSLLAFMYVFPIVVMAVSQGPWAAAVLSSVALGLHVATIGPGVLLSRAPRDTLALVVVMYGVALVAGEVNALGERAEIELARRLAALHDGIAGIGGKASIAELLQQSVAMGVELTRARYGAIAIWDEDGEPVYFFTAGMDPSEQDHLGKSPAGTGLLGVVRDAPGPIRLANPGSHPSATQLPPGHPPLGGFLGVPIPALGNWKGAYYLLHKPGRHTFSNDDERLCDMLAAHVASAVVMRRLAMSQREMHDGLLEMLVQISDTREHALSGHSKRVASFARTLGERAGLTGEKLDLVATAGLLHDLGKIGIPDSILGKPGALDEEERAIMMTHSALGAAVVERAGPLAALGPFVRYHHERWDGNGYPGGLKGEAIPLGARVVALADTLDAITGDRPYRAARSVPEALAEIERCSGTQFDPALVEIARGIIEERLHVDGKPGAGGTSVGSPGGHVPTLAEMHSTVQVAGWRLFTKLARELDVLADLPVLAERILGVLCADLDVSGAALGILDDRAEVLRIAGWHGQPTLLPIGTEMPRGAGIGWAAIEIAETVALADISSHPLFAGRQKEGCAGAGVFVPLMTGNATLDPAIPIAACPVGAGIEGVLALYRPSPQTFGPQDIAYLEAVAVPVAGMIAVWRMHAKLQELARTDSLTGAANRGYGLARLEEACAHAARTNQPFAAIMLDLDRFKEVNDRFGHQVGDRVLHEAVSRLHGDLRTEDVLARYGGDEFLVVVADATARQVAHLLRRIRMHRDDVITVGECKVQLPSWSLGVAMWPEDGRGVDALVRVADTRMYRAKQESAAHQRRASGTPLAS